MMMMMILLLDVTGGAGPVRPERLGGAYSQIRDEFDEGMQVAIWRNETLNRDEHWAYVEGNYYLRVAKGVYVLGIYDETAQEWQTRPSDRLVNRGGRWILQRAR
jgi:hypothetical protein